MNDNSFQPSINTHPERGISLQKASEILGYSYATVRRLVQAGELECYGTGKKRRVYESSIDRYRKKNTTVHIAQPTVASKIRSTGRRHREAMSVIENLLS